MLSLAESDPRLLIDALQAIGAAKVIDITDRPDDEECDGNCDLCGEGSQSAFEALGLLRKVEF